MAQQAESSRRWRPLVQCCPLSSNYFAYSSGVKGSGVEQQRICRSLQTDDSEQLADHGTAVGRRRGSIAGGAANANADRFSPDTSVHQQSHRSPIDHSNNNNNNISNNNSSLTLGEVMPVSVGARSRASSVGARSRDRDGFDGYDGYENPFVGAGPDFGLADDGADAVDGSSDPSLVASAPAAPAPWRSSVSGGTPRSSGGISGSAGCGGGSSSGVAGVGTPGLASSSSGGALFGTSQGSTRGDGVVIDGIGEGIGGGIGDIAGPSLGGRRASSACSDAGGGGFARSAWAKFRWWYPLEGRSTWWMAPKQEEHYVTCMRWFPHRGGPEGMRMLAVGYSSGKVGLFRFSDESNHGENVCVVAAASKGRACNAVAWDPARPERIAAGWAKSRHDKCVGVYDINYVEEWLRGNGVTLAEAVEARASAAAAAAAASAPASAPAASAAASYASSTMPASPASAGASSNAINTTTTITTTTSFGSLHGVTVSSGTSATALADSDEGLFHSGGGCASSGIGNFIGALGFSSTVWKGAAAGGEVVDAGGGIALSSEKALSCAASVPPSSAGATSKGIGGNGGGVWPVAKGIAGWDAPKVAARKVHEFQPSASDGCYCLAWVPEHDAMLMAGMKHLNLTDTRARYYSMKTLDPHRGAGVSGISFRPTDPWMFATWSDAPGEVVKIWDYRDLRRAWDMGKCRPTHPELSYLPGAATSSVIDVAWSPDDVNVLAVVRSDSPRRVCFWDVRGNTPEKVPQHYRYTKNTISSLSWQRRGLKPRPSPGASTIDSTTIETGGGGNGSLVQKRSPENVARTLVEDQRVALKFPHRLLTASPESITVENIGEMERCPLAISCHGDVMRAQGFCELLGSMERSGVRTRADYDACDVISRPRGFHHHVRAVRKVIAYSPKPPDILEVMKWRAQAGYRTDPVFNRTDIFERELADQIAATTKSGGVVGQQQKQQQPQMVTVFGSGIPTRTLAEIADVRSACRLWLWIARIEALAATAVTTAADRRRPGAGAGIGTGIGGPMGQPSTPRSKPRGQRGHGQPSAVGWTEWNRLGLVDSGVMDILAEEFEDAAASQTTAAPSQTRHPTLGCAVFCSPARALAIRACGWAPPAMMPSISAPILSFEGECDTGLESGDKRLKECPGVPEGLGDLMLACERRHQYERSAALAVFHGDLRAAVKALRRAGEAAKLQQQQQQQHQETAAKATSSKGQGQGQGQRDSEDAVGNRTAHAQALWSDPAALEKLLHAISVCIAGYRPPRDTQPKNPSQPQADAQAHEAVVRGGHGDIFGDEGQCQCRMWRELTAEVLGRKELCGTDEPQARYLRACCAFLDAIAILEAPRSGRHHLPGSSGSGSSGSGSSKGSGNRVEKGFALKEFLQETALLLSDRIAVACMFLPTEDLKAFLTAEAERCVSGGILGGVLLVGMAPRGLQLLQAYVDRTADVQTAALASIRAAALYPNPNTDSVQSTNNSSATHDSSSRILLVSWEAERRQVEEWLESYCILLDKWQFIFNRKKIRKFFEHERDRVRDSRPLSPQAASRLDAIKLRHPTPSTAVAQAAFAAAAAAAAAAATARNVPSNGSSSSTGQRPPSNRASSSSGSALAEASPSAAGQGATAGESSGGGGGLESHLGVSAASVVNNTRRSSGGGGFGGDYPRGGLPERRCAMCLPAALERRYCSDNDEEDHDFDFEEEPPKPIIACCAKCKKPLPRCYICMQQSDAFDPSTEKKTKDFEALVREAAMVAGRRFSSVFRTEREGGREEDAADRRRTMLEISFNWCQACRHGGHSIHLEQWFDDNDECGVEGCRCRCRALDEPAARWPPRRR